MKLLSRKKKFRHSPVVDPVSKKTLFGQHSINGGAWSQVAHPRRWMESNWDGAGLWPFVAGTGRPQDGIPIGYDLSSGTAVAMDHMSLYQNSVITSPDAMVFGRNGFGKSSIAGLVAAGLNARGVPLSIFDPIKGEWVKFARESGADVFELGIRSGKTKINPMALGPLALAGKQIGGVTGDSMRADSITQLVRNINSLVRINRGHGMTITDTESTMIKLAVEQIVEVEEKPALGHLLHFFDNPSERALIASSGSTVEEFKQIYSDLYKSIAALIYGEMSQVFSDSDVNINPGNPAGFCFDSSSIPENYEQMISAVMMSTWRLGMDAVDAHWELAQHERQLVMEAAADGQVYTPKYTWHGYSALMDEFWFPIRMADGMVDAVDRLSRTNRSVGVGTMKITHSPEDFLMLPNAHDQKTAHSMINKCGLWILLALGEGDITALSKVREIKKTEADWIKSFGAGATGLEYQNRYKGPDGHTLYGSNKAHYGMGKAIWKIEDAEGIPVQSPKTPTLAKLHNTDTRFTKRH